MNWTIIQLFVLIELSFSLAPHELIIFIISQPDEYNYQLAEELRFDLYNQSSILSINTDNLIQVYLLHETFNHPGYWTFLAILPELESSNIIKENTKWMILCEDRSKIDLKLLIKQLNSQDHNQIAYFGYPLYDDEATIIHHFAFFENPKWFSYPLLRAGVIFTIPLIKRLTKQMQKEKPTMDFFIDASHELSLFMWQNIRIERLSDKGNSSQHLKYVSSAYTSNNITTTTFPSSSSSSLSSASSTSTTSNSKHYKISKEPQSRMDDHNIIKKNNISSSHEFNNNTTMNNKTMMTISNKLKDKNVHDDHHQKGFNNKNENNVTGMWRKLQMTTASYLCSEKALQCAIYPNKDITACKPIRPELIYFAIKTCQKFHKNRIPTIETTWGQYVVHKRYFSDVTDDTIPTISTGIPNTETGHCSKTLSILKLTLEDITEINHQYRLKKKPMIEWIFLSDDDTILSVSAVCNYLGCLNPEDDIYLGERYGYRLHSKDGFNYITGGGGIIFSLPTVRKIVTSCSCPTISSPDDMIIGICLQRLGVKAIHSSKFHQARPPDYSSTLLTIDEPISFHKFWQINPIKIYKKWFKNADNQLSIISKLKSNNDNNCDINSSRSNTKFKKNFQNGNSLEYKKFSSSSSIKQQHIEL